MEIARGRQPPATRFVEGPDAGCLEITDGWHPLLEAPVPNSVSLSPPLSTALLTGARTGAREYVL